MIAAKGFRPFFLLAGAFAALALPVWLLTLGGVLGAAGSGYLSAVSWHAHEMIFGFAVAVFAGFLLTAVSNWTGRETLVGTPLLAVCALWTLGRIAMALPASRPHGAAALVDLAFLPVLVLALARPLVATKNWRNLMVVAALAVLWLANVAIHLDALGVLPGASHRGLVVALDVVVFLMIAMTGRIVPMFTKNATGVSAVRAQPALDKAALAAMAALSLLDATTSDARLAGTAALVTAVLVGVRSRTWGTRHTARVPMLWILHAGHAWIVAGLMLRGAAAFTSSVPAAVATHALTVGAVGGLTLGMMSRVALGHTGRPLASSPAVTLSFGLMTAAAMVRVLGPLLDAAAYRTWLFASGILWSFAFALFVLVHAPVLAAARADGKPG
jgi:uncharacterized protein involved in response to NO